MRPEYGGMISMKSTMKSSRDNMFYNLYIVYLLSVPNGTIQEDVPDTFSSRSGHGNTKH